RSVLVLRGLLVRGFQTTRNLTAGLAGWVAGTFGHERSVVHAVEPARREPEREMTSDRVLAKAAQRHQLAAGVHADLDPPRRTGKVAFPGDGLRKLHGHRRAATRGDCLEARSHDHDVLTVATVPQIRLHELRLPELDLARLAAVVLD